MLNLQNITPILSKAIGKLNLDINISSTAHHISLTFRHSKTRLLISISSVQKLFFILINSSLYQLF